MTPMQDAEHLVFEPAHPLLLVDLGMVVAEEVERAVDREQDELLADTPVALGRLAQRLVDVDDHVAEEERARRGDAVVIGQVRELVPVERPVVKREGEHVGRSALAHVVEVEPLHLGIAGQGQLDLGGNLAGGRVDGLAHRRLDQGEGRIGPQRLDRLREAVVTDPVVEGDRAAHDDPIVVARMATAQGSGFRPAPGGTPSARRCRGT